MAHRKRRPATTTLYVGMDWSEQHHTPGIERGWKPWTVRFPMCERPYLTKADMLGWARAEGIRPPRAYDDGFAHISALGGRVWITRRAPVAVLLRYC